MEKRKRRELTERELQLRHLQWLKHAYRISRFFTKSGEFIWNIGLSLVVVLFFHLMFINVTREAWFIVSVLAFGVAIYSFGKWLEPKEYLPKG